MQQSKKQAKSLGIWLPSLNLSHKDKEILLSPTAWITDSIVNAAQQVLREQFPQLPGLQDVSLGPTMAFNIMPGEFLQILHTSQDHWLTISTIGVKHPTVKIYDSLFNVCLSSLAKAQITNLLCSKLLNHTLWMLSCRYVLVYTKHEYVTLNSLQFRSGTYDCGVFSIAYAMSLAYGVDPCRCMFDQSRIRHLHQCFMKRRMAPFPHTKVVTTGMKSKTDDTEVHCHCRMPELKDIPMIECSKCSKWFHIDCEAVPKQILDDSLADWFCHYRK